MKLYMSVKTMLKSLKSSFILNLIYFLALPLILSWFLGMVTESMFQNPIKTESTPIVIYDKDNTRFLYTTETFYTLNCVDVHVRSMIEHTPHMNIYSKSSGVIHTYM
ncbi:hypothetical protein BGU49_16010 [Clostridioides difficile]|nr:hypothetical protein BGU49_16010 [Clostridioides difficile]